jgi:hypothetical protein
LEEESLIELAPQDADDDNLEWLHEIDRHAALVRFFPEMPAQLQNLLVEKSLL